MISSPLPRPIKEFYIVWRINGWSVTGEKSSRPQKWPDMGRKQTVYLLRYTGRRFSWFGTKVCSRAEVILLTFG